MRKKGLFEAVLVVVVLFASMPIQAAHPESGENAPVDGFMGDLIGNVQDTEKKLVALAEAMPAEMYGWAPSVEVRTFSETLIHVAAANLFIPMALGAPPAEGLDTSASPMVVMQKMEAEITAKDEVIAKLSESFAYVYRALPAIENIDEKVELFGPPASKRSYFFILQGHAHEHLGQAIAYARSVGVTPPWSRPAPADEDEDAAGESGSD